MIRNALLALALLGLATPALAQDSDGDGVPDAADAFPCEASMSAIQYAPSAGAWSLLLFEDQWPDDSDLDFNDVAVRVHHRMYRNAQGRVVRLNATFDPLAVGGMLTNGLGLQLPVSRTSATVRRRVAGGAWETLAFESDADATVIVSSNLRELFGDVEGPINASPDEPRLTGQQIELEISFALPATLNGALAPFDVFIFRADDFGHQIHLPRYRGTEAMNTALFGAGIDGTTAGRAFVDAQGLPFALDLATSSRYPHEGVAISTLFPDIVGFAASGGALNTSFYAANVAAQNGHDISALALPAEPAASTACVIVPLAISPTSAVMASSSTRVFTASGGRPPYVYSVVSGGGSFSGSTYTAPSSGSTAVVRVTDAVGATAQATVTLAVGGVSFTTAGTQSWTVPPGVTVIHAVVVGGGGGGAMIGGPVGTTNYGGAGSGGAGGGLSYRNSIAVTPGQVLSITVGAGGTAGASAYSASVDGGNGGTSQIAGLLSATGGTGGRINNTVPSGGTGSGGTANRTGGAGGVGSASGSPGGGGGAAGYSGNGGAAATANGGNGSAGAGGGGGGGSGGFPGNGYGGGAGGGVGLLGLGSNGAGGVFVAADAGTSGVAAGGGGGGSAGTNGAASGTGGGGIGGAYGGGGSSGRKHPSVMTGWGARAGGSGAVRIIWGAGRSFPSNAN